MLITNEQLKAVIHANFADMRCTAILLFVRSLLERKKHGGGVEQYRLTNKTTKAKITTVDEFIAAIDAEHLSMAYYRNAERMGGDRMHPFSVMLDNIQVEFSPHAEEDRRFTETYGGTASRIMLLINYLSDADPDLPLKVFEIKIV